MEKMSNKDLKKVNGGATKKSSSKKGPIVEARSSKNTQKHPPISSSTSTKSVKVLNLPKKSKKK